MVMYPVNFNETDIQTNYQYQKLLIDLIYSNTEKLGGQQVQLFRKKRGNLKLRA